MVIINPINPTQGDSPSGFGGIIGSKSSRNRQDVSINELLTLAQLQGGRVAEIAQELSGESKRSLLSTIGQGTKKAFSGFIEAITVPGQIVSGMISPDWTIKEAIEENKRISDAIFRETNLFSADGQPTTMQKIGDFIVRLPTDILLDPLTYVTFGSHKAVGILGKMGFGANSKVSLLKKGAARLGKNIDDGEIISRALNDTGQELLLHEKRIIEAVKVGGKKAVLAFKKSKEELLNKGIEREVLDMMEIFPKKVLDETWVKKFDPDVAKKIIGDIIERNPALVDTIIDKGGVKFLGKTLLEGQRIGSMVKIIPGMKKLDDITLPWRNAVQAMFDPAMTGDLKTGFTRIPEYMVQARSKLWGITAAKQGDFLQKMDNVQRTFKLNQNELDILTSHINTNTLPADSRLQSAYQKIRGIKEESIEVMRQAGIPPALLDNHVGLISVTNDTRRFRGNSTFAAEAGATKQAKNIKAIKLAKPGEIQAMPEVQKVLGEVGKGDEVLKESIEKARTIEDVRDAIGQARDDVFQSLKNKGLSIEKAIKDPEYLRLDKLQQGVKDLVTKDTLVGARETAKLKGISDEVIAELGDDVDAINYLMDNEGVIFKRVATTAQELKAHGIEGFDTNLLTALTTRGMQNIRQALAHEFAEGMVRNFGKWGDEAPDTWVTMSSSLVNNEAKAIANSFVRGDGVEMKFHPAVARAFDEMVEGLGGGDEATAAFLRGYDKVQSYYKSWLTTVFPMFHGRNAISNVLLNYLDIGTQALNPAKHGEALSLIKDDRTANKLMRLAEGTGDKAAKASGELSILLKKKVFTDKIGHTWTFGELRRVLKNNNVAFNPNLTGAMDVITDAKKLAKHYAKTPKKRMLDAVNLFNQETFGATKLGREIGRGIEEQSRLINFVSNLMDTGDVTHAAERTKMFLFDYQFGLSRFEKGFMRRIIPFYSFTRFNLELQAKTLMSAPGKIAAEVKAVQSLGSIFDGEVMSKEEKELLPEWLHNSLNIKRRTKDGGYEVITGFGTPIEQPFQALGTGSGILGSISPIIKLPLEKLTGFNMFRGKPTSEVFYAKDFRGAPEAIKQFIGYDEFKGVKKDGTTYDNWVSLRPENMQLLLSMPYSRVIPTISKITDKDVSGGLRALQAFTGIRAQSFDEELLRQRQDREQLQQMEKLLQKAGIRGSFTRGFNRKDTIRE